MNNLIEERNIALVDMLDRLLSKGIFISGDLIISVANVDLLYVGLRAIITSVETLHRQGLE
jgi:gas vesicle structural protein